MATANFALGRSAGLRGELARQRKVKIEDEDRTTQRSELEHVRQRRGVVEAKQDAEYTETQSDRATARARSKTEWDARQREMTAAMEEEGVKDLAEAIDAGVDPETVAQRFNSKGNWKIQPGTIRFDPKSKALSFTGEGGQQFTGTTTQLRSLFGVPPADKKPNKFMSVGEKSKVFNETTQEWITPPGGDKGDDEGGGRKVSPFNPEGYAKDAADGVAKYFQGTYDPKIGVYNFDPGTRDKALYGMSLAGQLSRYYGSTDAKLNPQEISDFAARTAAEIPTDDEADAGARRELGPKAEKTAIDEKKQLIMREARVKAGQKMNDWMAEMDAVVADAEAEQKAKGNGKPTKPAAKAGAQRPPLSSFQRK